MNLSTITTAPELTRSFSLARSPKVQRLAVLLALLCLPAFVSTRARSDLLPSSGSVATSLSGITGADPAQCQQLIADLTGADPSTLLDGLTPGQAAELLALVAELTGLQITTSPATSSTSDPPLLKDSALRDMARELEERMVDHLHYGQVFGVFYATADKLPGTVVNLDSAADSTLWSGAYLAAESFRYALARHHRNTARNHGQAVVWGKEMDRAKARVLEVYNGTHRNINLSKSWNGSLVNGEPGLPFRRSFPEGVPAWQFDQSADRNLDNIGPLAWDDGRNYYARAKTTRDQYAGIVFGLAAAFDNVGPDDPILQAKLRDDLILLTDYLLRHGWWVVYPTSSRTSTNPTADPLFVITPSARLHMAQTARRAARVAGGLTDIAKWEAVWNEEVAMSGQGLQDEALLEIQGPHDSYFSENLQHLRAYGYIGLEPNLATRLFLKQGFAIVDNNTRDDINAHFETITYALTGEPQRLQLAIKHLRDWLGYRINWNIGVHNSILCGNGLDCIPEDQVTTVQQTPLGPVENVRSGSSAKGRSNWPLPVGVRPGSDFLWQRSPFRLDGGQSPTGQSPGVDFLLPYYMLRCLTEVAAPRYEPFPAYVGPTTH